MLQFYNLIVEKNKHFSHKFMLLALYNVCLHFYTLHTKWDCACLAVHIWWCESYPWILKLALDSFEIVLKRIIIIPLFAPAVSSNLTYVRTILYAKTRILLLFLNISIRLSSGEPVGRWKINLTLKMNELCATLNIGEAIRSTHIK